MNTIRISHVILAAVLADVPKTERIIKNRKSYSVYY